jgi:hypothetical protein
MDHPSPALEEFSACGGSKETSTEEIHFFFNLKEKSVLRTLRSVLRLC